MTELNRRRALSGAATVAVGLPVLAACGDDSSDTADDPTSASSPSTGDGAEPTGDDTLAATADVPVGGCFVVEDSKVVLTQPTEGDFKAFSATCTHQGCQVSSATDGVIPCACHGSQFSLEDGSVLQGPASSALTPVQISVDGESISLA